MKHLHPRTGGDSRVLSVAAYFNQNRLSQGVKTALLIVSLIWLTSLISFGQSAILDQWDDNSNCEICGDLFASTINDAYTPDKDCIDFDDPIGDVGEEAFLPNGADEIKLVHYEDDLYGTGWPSTANSVVPVSVCIAYDEVDCDISLSVETSANTACVDNDGANCDCEDYIYEFTVEYTGPSGVGGGAYDYHDNEYGYWTLQNGEQYTFNVSNSNHPGEDHEHNDPMMWTYEGGWVHHGTFDATCGQSYIGQSFGPFTLVGYVDVNGNECGGSTGCNGSADLTVSNGSEPYSYLWSDGSTDGDRDDLCPGDYTVTVTDSNGCAVDYSLTIGQEGFNIEASATTMDNAACGGDPCDVWCFESTDGNPDVGAQMSIDVQENANSVTLRTIYAKTFCDNTYGDNQIGWPDNNHTFDKLKGSDKLELTLYNGDGDVAIAFELDYLDDGQPTSSGYGTGGVTDGDGDMITGSESHILDVKTSLSENLNTFGYELFEDSPATDDNYTPNPAYPNWIFEVWYEVTIDLDAFGASGWGYPTITDFHASPSKTGNNSEPVEFAECCGGPDCTGSIDLTVNEGEGPFTFLWSNGETTEDIYGLCEGDYTVEVFDANGCSESFTFTIGQEDFELDVSATTSSNTACVDNDGANCDCEDYIYEFTVEYTGPSGVGGGAYDYHDNEYGYWTLQNGEQYTFNVSNSNHPGEDHEHNDPMMWTYEGGWVHHGTFDATCGQSYIGQSFGPFTLVGYVDVNGNECGGSTGCNGSADLTVSNGSEPYSYLWSDGSTDGDRDDLCPGDYTVTVTDSNGCAVDYSLTIGQEGFNIEASATTMDNAACGGDPCDVWCFESTDGNPDVGAQMSIDVQENANSVTLRTIYAKTFCDNTYGDNQIGWPDNNHTFDKLKGSDKLELTLYNGDGDVAIAFELDYLDDGQPTSSGYGTGGVTDGDGDMITGSESHILDVKTSLSENLNTFGYELFEDSPATDDNYTPNPAYPNWIFEVWYEVTIDLDAFGASGWGYPTITDFHASPSKTGNNSEPVEFAECCGGPDCTGSIDLTVNEGEGPFTFLWSNGETTEDIYGLCEGDYTVEVFDANGCSESFVFTVEQGEGFDVTIESTDATCPDSCNGTASVTIEGGTGNYEVLWSNGETTTTITGLCPETYSVTITYGDCDASGEVTIVAGDNPEVTVESTGTECGDDSGTITFTFPDNPNRTNIEFSLDGGATWPAEYNTPDNIGSFTINGLSGGTYDLAVRWGNDECEVDLGTEILDDTEITLEITNQGICIVDLYEWLPSGDVFVVELEPGDTYTVSTTVGDAWRIVGDDWNLAGFDESYNINECYDQVWNVYPDYCSPDCVLEVDAGDDVELCEGEEADFTAAITGETDCNEIIGCYYMTDATASSCAGAAGTGVTAGTGVVWQRGPECSGSHTIWQAGDDLKFTEYADGTAIITGTITLGGQVGEVFVQLFDKETSGNTWNASCYTSNLGDEQTFYTSFLGTITVGDEVFTVEEKTSEKHFIISTGAGFNPGELGMGSWTAGSWGACTEWFVELTPCPIPNQDLQILWSTGETTQSITVSEAGTYSVTVTDCAGCVATDEVTLVVEDLPEVSVNSTDPNCDDNNGSITFTFPDNPNRTNIEFSLDGGATWPAEYNTPDNIGSFTINGLSGGTYDLAVRWGNDECEVNLPVVTMEPGCFSIPEIVTGVDSEVSVECDEDLPTDEPEFADACDGSINVSFEETQNDLDCLYEIVRIWTATNACGQAVSVSQTITVVDTTAPTLVGVPADMTLECDQDVPDAIVVAQDNCDDDLTVSLTAETIELNCGAQLIRTWSTMDDCGNEASASQTITFVDTTAPTVVSQTPDMTLECDEDIPEVEVTFLDNCDGDLTVVLENWVVDLDCGYEYHKACTATDDCGNATTVEVTFTILDTTDPYVIDGVEPELTLECDESEPNVAPTFGDNCDDNLDITAISGITNVSDCGWDVERAWTATDDCGNSTTVTQVIHFLDTTAPVLTVPADAVVDCDNGDSTPANTGMAAATDNCSTPEITFEDGLASDDCPATFERTWTATDDCGNTVSDVQLITINDDTNPILDAPADITIECDESTDPDNTGSATATDNCSVPTVWYTDGPITGSCPQTLIRTWHAEDPCGNVASEDQVITIEDTTPPVAPGPGEEIFIYCTEDVPTLEMVFTDNCDDNLEITVTTTIEPWECLYRHIQTCTATDDCGNSTSVQHFIYVIDDVAPTLIGVPADMTMECDEDVPDAIVVAQDDCDDDLTVSLTTETVPQDCGYLFIRTWSTTDDCGNSVSQTQTITVVDTTAPVLSDHPDDMIVDCGSIPTPVVLTATDNCDDDVGVEFNELIGDGCPYEITRTWSAADDCGNMTSHSQVITVIDTTAPVLVGVPDDYSSDCGDAPEVAEVTATDNCDSDVPVEFSEEVIGQECPITVVRTWTATDDCDNTVSASQTIVIDDEIDPVLVGVPADETVECDSVLAPADVTATDNCDIDPVVNFNESIDYGDCEGEYVITRTWTATDLCGNSATAAQVVTVIDTTDPVLTGVPEDETVECDAVPAPAEVTASDNCATTPIVVTLTEEAISADCGYTLIRIWTAHDGCGNTASASQVITVIDTTAPTLVGVPADMTIECDQDAPDAIVIAQDNCDEDLTVSLTTETIDQDCGYLLIRTWSTMDDCGNMVSESQTITVVDTTAPEADNDPADMVVECDNIPAVPEVTWTDNCYDEVGVSYFEVPEVIDACTSLLTRIWIGTDNCGNTAQVNQVLTIVDTTAPVITCPADVDVSCDNSSTEPADTGMAIATDNCSSVTIEYMDGEVSGDCPATFVRTWTATDECGNVSTCTQSITVSDDSAPVIDCPADVTVDCDGDISPAATGEASATDNCGTAMVTYLDGEIIGSCPYTIERTWTATDNCGNASSCVQVITIDDNTPPTISGEDNTIDLECNVAPSVADPEVSDNCDDDVNVVFNIENVPGDCPNNWTDIYTWTATDECGNSAVRTLTFNFSDNTAPELSSLPVDAQEECDAITPTAVLTATDNCDDDVEVEFSETEQDVDGCIYTITRVWTATDDCGNSTSHTQVVTVVDTTDPVVVNGVEAEITIECDQPEPTDMPTFADNCDDELDLSAISGINNVSACGYDIEKSWTATDDCGNSVTVSQVIHVVDTTAPSLNGVPADVTVECDEIPAPADVTGSDNCDDDVQVFFFEEYGAGCPYTITRTWTAVDDCGYEITDSQVITVIDEEAPVLIGVPADITEECGDIPPADVVTATDNCSINLEVEYSEETIGEECPLTIIRTWTVTDDCGNTTSDSQTIVIDDQTPPVIDSYDVNPEKTCDQINDIECLISATDNCSDVTITWTDLIGSGGCTGVIIRDYVITDVCGNEAYAQQIIQLTDEVAPELIGVPADVTVECTDVPAVAEVIAVDNCDDDVVVEFSQTSNELVCGYEIIRTWTSTDDCSNTVEESQVITVVDTTNPEVEFTPANVTVECDEALPTDDATFSDNCDDELTVTSFDETTDLTCGYMIVRTWTATDDCGNSISTQQTINVVDTTDPVLEAAPADMAIECSDIPAPAELSATDNCDDDVDVSFSETINAGECPYTITRTWTATDDCGNSVSVSQTLTVNDTTDPELSGVPADVTVDCNSIPAPADVTATDNCSLDLTAELSESTTANDCGYTLTRTWTVEDPCGNSASASQIITVTDEAAPVASNEPADASYECDEVIPMDEPSFTDSCDDDVQVDFNESVESDGCTSIITRTWTAMDDCGNTAVVSQDITVTDTTDPVLVGVPADEMIECDEEVPTYQVTATDNCTTALVVEMTEETVDADCGYSIVRTWTVADDCGNSAVASQTITVTDITAPVIAGVPADETIECGGDVPAPAVITATDNCDPAPETDVTESTVALDCGYQIVRTYSAIDECGNEATAIQTITVTDNTAPVILNAPEDMTVDCTDVSIAPTLLAEDNCDDNVQVILDEVVGDGCPYTIIRTWTATDDCGNSSSVTQVITVVDEEAPVWDPFDTFIQISCDEIDSYLITASDNCDADVEVIILQELIFSGGCLGTVERTYQATDDCGNSILATQLLQLFDDEPPVLEGVPADIEINCDDEVPAIDPDVVTALDNCDADVEINYSVVQSGDFCPYTITHTWQAIDNCNNVTEVSMVIEVTIQTPEMVSLMSYPNPFNDVFNVEFSVPADAYVLACIYDMAGREVHTVHKGQVSAHTLYNYKVYGADWEAGSYIIMMQVDEEVYYHKMMVIDQK